MKIKKLRGLLRCENSLLAVTVLIHNQFSSSILFATFIPHPQGQKDFNPRGQNSGGEIFLTSKVSDRRGRNLFNDQSSHKALFTNLKLDKINTWLRGSNKLLMIGNR